ncbi:MAG: histidinol-phosphate transaminase [Oscillospiraceae bacterium]|jgi:histidinol-phosphate aminotransferase|nr:histidinol-phosphate transaminase [Oscillospiraceae bacterium]
MSKFLADRFNTLDPYIPGEQPLDMEYIKLNTNESPYPPPKAVIEAITEKELEKLNLYPDPEGFRLINKIAEKYNVKSGNVIIGNGSDELLAFTFLAFFTRKGVIFPDITYGFYPIYANLYDVKYKQIALDDDLNININDYINTGKDIIIANPNAPTGIYLDLTQVEKLCSNNPENLIVIDEAYIDYGGETAIPLIEKYDNLLVIHTYSKGRSMAGARLAYAIAQEPIINDLKIMKNSFNPYNVNRLTLLMGEIALNEEKYYKEKHQEIIETREYATKRLKEIGFELTDSKANFVFAKHPKIKGYELYLALKEKGVLVRNWSTPRISDYIRISIGTKPQMEKLIDVIRNLK